MLLHWFVCFRDGLIIVQGTYFWVLRLKLLEIKKYIYLLIIAAVVFLASRPVGNRGNVCSAEQAGLLLRVSRTHQREGERRAKDLLCVHWHEQAASLEPELRPGQNWSQEFTDSCTSQTRTPHCGVAEGGMMIGGRTAFLTCAGYWFEWDQKKTVCTIIVFLFLIYKHVDVLVFVTFVLFFVSNLMW